MCMPVIGLLLILLVASTVGLQGCSKQPKPNASNSPKTGERMVRSKENPGLSFFGNKAVPIRITEGNFQKIIGWIDDDTIIYLTNLNNGSNLFSYDLGSGKSMLLFESQYPIVTVEVSPSRDKLLVHSSPSTYEGLLTILEVNGKELFSTKVESFELSFEWSAFDEDTVLVSAFTEEWDFTTYLLNIKNQKLSPADLPVPFAHWSSDDQLTYLEWNDSSPSLVAPLVKRGLTNGSPETIRPDVYHLDSFGKQMLAVSVDEKDQGNAVYNIFSEDFQVLATIKNPQLSSFSGWLVPYYDMMENGGSFIYLRPLYSGEADMYGDGFQLVRYDLKSKAQKKLFEGLENEPLSCSPGGTMCLYGNQLEKLLDLKAGEMVLLIE
ncbi:hypothetical protein CVD19_23760 [Bacillus sp. T33-2]|nr:hypothetical protein CVD19_23760 [Bacillus sp. T33-2]